MTIDEIPVAVEEGTSILEAAQTAGIYIPAVCYHPDLPPFDCKTTPSQVEAVPEKDGVFQLLDSEKNIVCIKGAMNLREELEEQGRNLGKPKYFLWEEDPMYTKRESELLQQFMQEHGKLPEGNAELDDDLF